MVSSIRGKCDFCLHSDDWPHGDPCSRCRLMKHKPYWEASTAGKLFAEAENERWALHARVNKALDTLDTLYNDSWFLADAAGEATRSAVASIRIALEDPK